jgi:hypothetical protein
MPWFQNRDVSQLAASLNNAQVALLGPAKPAERRLKERTMRFFR